MAIPVIPNAILTYQQALTSLSSIDNPECVFDNTGLDA